MRRPLNKTAFFLLPIVCLIFVAGCLGRTKPAYVVDQYTLEYDVPAVTAQEPIGEFIRVERFAVASDFNSTSMVIRSGQYRFDTYGYSRWRSNPADMVSSLLLRDIARSGMFKGTYSYYDTDISRYVVEGYINEFCEHSDGSARVSVRVSFIDTARKDAVGQVLFQRQYTGSAPMKDRSPEGLAAGLSEAMKDVSGKVMADISTALKGAAAGK